MNKKFDWDKIRYELSEFFNIVDEIALIIAGIFSIWAAILLLMALTRICLMFFGI